MGAEIDIDIYDLIADEKYWEVDTDVYYTHHMYRNSPYETCSDCGNCDGARCNGCKKIRETSLKCSIPTDELYDMLISKGVDEATASDFAYLDSCKTLRNNFRFYWPTGNGLKARNPELYAKLVGDAEIKEEVLKEFHD